MGLNMKTRYAWIGAACLLLVGSDSLARQGEVRVETMDNMVSGLPMPMRFTVTGSAEIVNSSLLTEYVPYEVRLEEQAFSLRVPERYIGMRIVDQFEIDSVGPDGRARGHLVERVREAPASSWPLGAGEVSVLMMDLSLQPANRWVGNAVEVEGIKTEDWPAGVYTLAVVADDMARYTLGHIDGAEHR